MSKRKCANASNFPESSDEVLLANRYQARSSNISSLLIDYRFAHLRNVDKILYKFWGGNPQLNLFIHPHLYIPL